ncbi:hypothetical protein GQF61_03885 [Sphingobacterium sp. DK4209]|uniref:Uncharacterized protein n=1 Tax=Sphingobacterium zhuxiongii TaxID=2662364 RepID=A0A5Q0Q7I6_9SPHI|nr:MULTISPECIES: hypothetical protein [unclassified Sphingobacterium]MVZ64978.1 hypothetical protein [Sphingobacterium sp. DK4209]QGA25316.1 hypothetical protein GFH32_02840 [Sphingobacterium sp. dk4302]
METKLYNPFLDFKFDNSICFLTGKALQSGDEQIQVFPTWMMRAFDLEEKPFKMLDESFSTYKKLQLPCSIEVANAIEALDRRVEYAVEQGYEAVEALEQEVLFQWIAKILYGVVFNEIQAGIRQAVMTGEEMNFSQALVQKFRNLHAMLQSLILPMEFEHKNPFTIEVFHVDNADDTFLYRDEINTLIFSLRMKNFGLIATLQDNGTNAVYHEEALTLSKGQKLHPIQFEEIGAKYFYTAYLFNRLPAYTYMEVGDQIFVEPMALNDWTMKPIFDNWQAKTYGQVLENFWEPWGYTLFEIIKDPENPMSFLKDEQGQFRQNIELPR